MMFRMYLTLFLGITFTLAELQAQSPLYSWRDYLNYSRAIDADVMGQEVYTATTNAVFIYNKDDNSMQRINRINGLSDIGIEILRTYPDKNLVFIGYQNGNIDLIEDGSITNYADLKNSTVIGDKAVRHVTFYENTAFISTGVGVLEFDIDRHEIRDTYTVSANGDLSFNETTVLNDTLYVCTQEGLYYGDMTKDLTIFSNWTQDLSIPAPFNEVRNCETYANRVYINLPDLNGGADPHGVYYRSQSGTWELLTDRGDVDYLSAGSGRLTYTNGYYAELVNIEGTESDVSIYNYGPDLSVQAEAIIVDDNGIVWLADKKGLVRRHSNTDYEFIYPEGPGSNFAFDLDFKDGVFWVASGAPSRPGNWSNNYVWDGFYKMQNQSWTNFTRNIYTDITDDLFIDVCKIYIDPANTDRAFVGSYFSGMYEVVDNQIVERYTDQNSSIGAFDDFEREDGKPWLGITGFARDDAGGLWVSNPNSDNPVSYWGAKGNWQNFSLNGVLGTNRNVLDLIIDDNGQKWAIVNRAGLVVFNENGNSGLDVKRLTVSSGNGGLPSNETLCISEDLDGELWVGTVDGVAVFYSPFDILSDNPSDARRILVEQDGVFQYLLEGQSVSVIAIDGANRKWIGTFGAGVFLMSEDGTEQIERFTVENSPLFSNNINDIVIDQKSGEVFIATQEGIISYVSDATSGKRENDCTTVYPNPVRETYAGPISITGLKRDSEVRITDVRGNLIYKMVSNGGTAIWDGKNVDGVRVATGVYYALSTDTEGESGCATKILVVK